MYISLAQENKQKNAHRNNETASTAAPDFPDLGEASTAWRNQRGVFGNWWKSRENHKRQLAK